MKGPWDADSRRWLIRSRPRRARAIELGIYSPQKDSTTTPPRSSYRPLSTHPEGFRQPPKIEILDKPPTRTPPIAVFLLRTRFFAQWANEGFSLLRHSNDSRLLHVIEENKIPTSRRQHQKRQKLENRYFKYARDVCRIRVV